MKSDHGYRAYSSLNRCRQRDRWYMYTTIQGTEVNGIGSVKRGMKKRRVAYFLRLSFLVVVLAMSLSVFALDNPLPASAQTGTASTDRAALVALYNATGGANWTHNGNWLSDRPIGEWYGVTTDTIGRVVRIELTHNNLSGTIPIELSNLSELTWLEFGRNRLTGAIPGSLGSLSKLRGLYLYHNQLTGTIPKELGNLLEVSQLNLSLNKLSGAVPMELGHGNYIRVQMISMHDNQLRGALPRSFLKLPQTLTELYFSNNDGLCAPADEEFQKWLGSVARAGGLTCDITRTPSPTPMHAGDRAALVALYNATGGANWTHNANWLSNRPLGEWHGVTTDNDGRVTQIFLRENNLEGSIPAELGNLSRLTHLYLYRNRLSGEIPSELGNLSSLKWLSLDANELNGEIPSTFGNLSNIERMYLFSNQLSGEIPSELGNLSNLEVLALDDNELSGEIPASLGNLTNLRERLSLSSNQLSGEIPSELGNLSNLERLFLGQNELSGEIPSELGSLSNLIELSLWVNQLSGEIPPELGNLSNLTLLNLTRNQVSGAIPDELLQLSSLEILALGGNELSGGIPSELGNLTSLVELGLWGNQLSGEIPSAFGNLSSTERLYLSGNQLSGEIPSELGNLTSLTQLYLNDNQLTGTIPLNFTGLTSMEKFRFGNNAGLCAPTDTAFQGWLQAIPERDDGPNCGSSTTPAPAPQSSDRPKISAGGEHSCGLDMNDEVVCWGRNNHDQLDSPDGSFVSISPGTSTAHTCGLRENGEAVCWGHNNHDQLDSPDGPFAAISVGGGSTCGLRANGEAVCWGDDRFGQSSPPDGRFTAISGGGRHTCGLRANGEAVCWGDDRFGQSSPPDGRFLAISGGGDFTCSLRLDGEAVCWGANWRGQLNAPQGRFTTISSGWDHTCGLLEDGGIRCWGYNKDGRTSSPSSGHFVGISTSGWSYTNLGHSCGLRANGEVECWGANDHGQTDVPPGAFATPTTPAPSAFAHNPALDFNTLIASGNRTPEGIWSDGTTAWVSDDAHGSKAYAYNLATKQRDSARDFNTFAAAGNTAPHGIWSDGTTMWVAHITFDTRSKLYAYNLATKQHDSVKDINALGTAGNHTPNGIWSDGTTIWVADWADGKLYAYNLATKQHDSDKDFDTLIDSGNNNPDGVWSDGTTMWVSDPIDQKIYAYNKATKQRDSAKDFDTLAAAGNNNPADMWSDGTTLWVTDWGDGKIYAYNMPAGTSSPVQPPVIEEDCTATLTEDGSVDGTWSTECASQHPDRSGSYARYFTFEILEESDVTITLRSDFIEDGDTYLYLRQGENNRIGAVHLENDDHGDDSDNDFDLPQYASGITTTLQPGHYTIEATTYASGQTGDFTLTVSGLKPAVTTPTVAATGLIAFASTRDRDVDVHVMEVDEGSVTSITRLTDDAAFDWEPSWSPDGSRIAFTSISGSREDGNWDIYVMDADGSDITQLTLSQAKDDNPSWSPNGSRIAFTSQRDGNEEIYVINADGTGVTRLTNNSAGDWGPSWSPDGQRIAFVSTRNGNDEIYVMNADGSNASRLTNDPAADWEPSWSPDGRKIAFSSAREDRNHEIYVMDADGSDVVRLTDNRANDSSPSWSPDGGHIAFASERGGNTDIYMMAADGSGLARLTSHPGDDYQPAWSPVGGTGPGDETFELESILSANDVGVGESFTLTVRLTGAQPAGGHGGISVSFPGLEATEDDSVSGSLYSSPAADVEIVSYSTGLGDVAFHRPGEDRIYGASDNEPDTADNLLVEADDTRWSQGGDRELVLEITPNEIPSNGVFEILVRGWVCEDEYDDCERQPESSNEQDQQGWPVEELTVVVSEGVADSCETELTEDGSVDGEWESGCLSESKEDSYAKFYRFTLAEAAEVTITLESSDEDTVLYLLEGTRQDDASILCENDDFGTRLGGAPCDIIDFALTSQFDSALVANLNPGTYTIEATTYGEDATGEFTLTVSGIDAAIPPPRQDIEINQRLNYEGTILSVNLKPLEPETAPYRMLEIAIEDDRELDDRQFGEMTIVLPETAWVHYGGIEKWVKLDHFGDKLYVEYTQELENEMIHEHYVDAGVINTLNELLRAIIPGAGIFSEVTSWFTDDTLDEVAARARRNVHSHLEAHSDNCVDRITVNWLTPRVTAGFPGILPEGMLGTPGGTPVIGFKASVPVILESDYVAMTGKVFINKSLLGTSDLQVLPLIPHKTPPPCEPPSGTGTP